MAWAKTPAPRTAASPTTDGCCPRRGTTTTRCASASGGLPCIAIALSSRLARFDTLPRAGTDPPDSRLLWAAPSLADARRSRPSSRAADFLSGALVNGELHGIGPFRAVVELHPSATSPADPPDTESLALRIEYFDPGGRLLPATNASPPTAAHARSPANDFSRPVRRRFTKRRKVHARNDARPGTG